MKVVFMFLGAIVAAVLVFSACDRKTVAPGYVGVKVYLTGGSKGVDHEVVGVGRYWLGMNEDIYLFPVFQQNYVWSSSKHEGRAVDESIQIQSKEGLGINLDMGISYSIDPSKVATIFQQYHKGAEELTDVVLRNAVRSALNDQASRLSVDQIMGDKKMVLIQEALKEVQVVYQPQGILVARLDIIGDLRPPKTVTDALNAKIEAIQRSIQAENEVRQANAEADKARAKARGEADANKIKMQSLTPELIRYEAIQKWDGKLPSVTGSGALPFIQVNDTKTK